VAPRVLITEQLAARGLDAPRLSAEELATERPSGQREAAS
jgi:hypothetical protein